MTNVRCRPTYTQSEEYEMNMTTSEEENHPELNQSQLSKRVLSKLNHIFYELFDYLQNEDYKMENDAYSFLDQLKETYNHRDQLNENQIDAYDELIEKMRRDISGNLGYVYRTPDYDIPANHFEDLFEQYQNQYSSIFNIELNLKYGRKNI